MNDRFSWQTETFSLKRVLLTVALVQLVLASAMFIYWRVYQGEFFPYPINDDGSVTCEGAPLLIGYGVHMPPPWTFTGVGTDTLRLNGQPFEPLRKDDVTAELMPYQRDRIRTIKAILEEAENAYKASDGKEEGMRAFAAAMEPYLGGVLLSLQLDVENEVLTADFGNDIPEVTVNFLHDPHWVEPEGLIRSRHYGTMREFISWMEDVPDGVFCFGTGHLDLSAMSEDRRVYQHVLDILETMPRDDRRPLTPDDVRHMMADDELFARFELMINDFVLQER
ncbi:hypothetical protein H8E07_07665 [bacterium]|nr:hypothetical protein [bacterium]